jgi:oligo-1,6-glucosidase
VVHGDFTMLLPDDEQVYAFTRRLEDTVLLVVANVSSDEVTADVPDAPAWAAAEQVIGTHPPPEPSADAIALRPWESRVYRRTD